MKSLAKTFFATLLFGITFTTLTPLTTYAASDTKLSFNAILDGERFVSIETCDQSNAEEDQSVEVGMDVDETGSTSFFKDN
jgi:hypothetical protein